MLFNLATDRGEHRVRAAAEPEKARALPALWDKWEGEEARAAQPIDKRKNRAEKKKKKAEK